MSSQEVVLVETANTNIQSYYNQHMYKNNLHTSYMPSQVIPLSAVLKAMLSGNSLINPSIKIKGIMQAGDIYGPVIVSLKVNSTRTVPIKV